MTQLRNKNPLFETLMLGVSDQAFLLDVAGMRLINASQSACDALNATLPELQKKVLKSVLGVTKKALVDYVDSHPIVTLPNASNVVRFYPFNHLAMTMIEADEKQYLFAIKRIAEAKPLTLDENDSRFKVLVKNTLGLVFEFQMSESGEITFNYLSEGCRALLGIEAEDLAKSPQQFFAFMDANDRAILKAHMRNSAASLSMLNWEGRFWIDEWQDTKWVNVRSSPQKLANGAIQWSGIMTNITQSKSERIELEQSRRRLAELSAHLNSIKEQERTRIAREIHDDLGGNLTVIKMGLASLLKHLPADQQQLIEKTNDLKNIVDQTFETVHRISGDLRPNILELGIVAALDWQAKKFSKQMDIPCHFVTNKQDEKGTTEQAITLFRVCQEAMSNIAKYAQATRVDVALLFDQSEIKLLIADNGIGINPGDVMKPDAFGLRGMEERVAALQGDFSIERAANQGTNVTVILPNSKSDTLNADYLK